MKHNHLMEICANFNLGTPIESPTRVYGGLLHIMWYLRTDKASYAIKQLSADINLTNESVIKNYELSERIASRFVRLGIPAISAIEKTGEYLSIIDGSGYLVYPWVEAQALDKDAISKPHALKIADILAKMHLINLDVPEIVGTEFGIHTNDKILELINKAESFNCPFANDLRRNQNKIFAINDAYQNAIPVLKKEIIVSHGDLDQKNVLWDENNNPLLVDWESACKVNPTYDIINTAFYWSGITTDNYNQKLFIEIIHCYQKSGGIINKNHVEAAFYGTFSWLGWMIYNVERSCKTDPSSLDQKEIGVEQVQQTLQTILKLSLVIPKLMILVEERI
jgi:thiamine kinase-like enzyme